MITGWILAFSLYLTKPRKYESWWVVSQFQTTDGSMSEAPLLDHIQIIQALEEFGGKVAERTRKAQSRVCGGASGA